MFGSMYIYIHGYMTRTKKDRFARSSFPCEVPCVFTFINFRVGETAFKAEDVWLLRVVHW